MPKEREGVGPLFFVASKLFSWIILAFELSYLGTGSLSTTTYFPRILWDMKVYFR